MEQQTKQAYNDAQDLTNTIQDPQTKPALRSTIKKALLDLGHLEGVCNAALDQFFHKPKAVH